MNGIFIIALVPLVLYGLFMGWVFGRIVERGRDGLAWAVLVIMTVVGALGATYVLSRF